MFDKQKPLGSNKRDVWTVDDHKALFNWLYKHPHPQAAEFLAEFIEQNRNGLDVYTVATAPYKGIHFATFPPDLIKPCILAGCPTGGTVLDCFAGSGTTGQVALELGRSAILIELNPDYVKLIHQRLDPVTPGLPL